MAVITQSDYDEGLKLKEKGNAAFSQKDYQKALKYYSQIFLHIGMNPCMNMSQMLNPDQPQLSEKQPQSPLDQQTNILRLTTFNNMAMVFYKQGNYEKCKENCDKVLQCDAKKCESIVSSRSSKSQIEFIWGCSCWFKKAQELFKPKIDPAIDNELKLIDGDEKLVEQEFYNAIKKGIKKQQKINNAKIKKSQNDKNNDNNNNNDISNKDKNNNDNDNNNNNNNDNNNSNNDANKNVTNNDNENNENNENNDNINNINKNDNTKINENDTHNTNDNNTNN